MDDIIQKIIDFEKKAQAIVGEARDERLENEKIVNVEIEAFREELNKDIETEIKNYTARMNREAEEAIKHLEDAAKLKIVQMHKNVDNLKGDWIEHLYQKIIDGGVQ